MKGNIFFGILGLILGGWILVGGWYANQSSVCEDVELISKFNLVIGCALLLLSIYTLFFKSIRFLEIILTVVFLVILGVLVASPSGITETKFNNLYSEIIKEIEALHEIKDENQQAEEIRRIKANLPTNIGIISLEQRNYGYERAEGFHYKAEDYVGKPFGVGVSNSIGQRPLFPGLALGHILKENGCEKKILHYSKVLDKKHTRFLYLVLDYKTVKETMQNMEE